LGHRHEGQAANAAYEDALIRATYDRDTACTVMDLLAQATIMYLLSTAQARGELEDEFGNLSGAIEGFHGGNA
jgi:hypothetical protein